MNKKEGDLPLSPKSFNQVTGFAITCPIINQKNYPFEVKIPEGLKIEGVILTDQVKSLDWKERKSETKDKLPERELNICIRRNSKDYIYRFLKNTFSQ
ncbi:type II toxin-antitoxin system PemK/MazF family toxin [Pseudogracilibacillus sp. SO30301A]|uniref:type II toxin-antitoxin system PemK/MazF family toxin n=1 Tax=Pseudogracilibacillus sp. SO30301A TaxID=3098291 RepID=UPI00300E61BD